MRIPNARAFVLQFLTVMASVNLSVEPPFAAQDGKVIIVQTNAAGDNISLIDAATNTVVGRIEGIEVNHGAAAAPDGSRFYVSNEVEHTLDFVDARTLTITQKVSLSGRPNNVAITHDGRRVYVAIVSDPGAVDVIDTVSAKNVSSIKTAGGVHNTFMTPDGRYVVAGSIAGRNLTVIDVASERALWTLPFDAGVRPMSFETSPDGSTRRISYSSRTFTALRSWISRNVARSGSGSRCRRFPSVTVTPSTCKDLRRTVRASHRMGRCCGSAARSTAMSMCTRCPI